MNLSSSDKIRTLFLLVSLWRYLPKPLQVSFLLNPVDATRYTEFTYIIKYLAKHQIDLANKRVLDISSPYILAYFFFKLGARIRKTDINPAEAACIRPREHLEFEMQNAIHLTYDSDRFDFVYAVSVIEHIYEQYRQAVREMVRVCKPGGHIYLTFPVSESHKAEWLDSAVYPCQHEAHGRHFFQYRFDRTDLNEIVRLVQAEADIEGLDIYWQKTRGAYDRLTTALRRKSSNRIAYIFRRILLNYYYGLFYFPGQSNPTRQAQDFGNAHLVLRKKV